jgi:hypothetical protein
MSKKPAPLTVRDVVKAFGGHTPTSELFGVTVPAVSNWISDNRFPDRLHLRVLRECEAKGIKYDPACADQAAAE